MKGEEERREPMGRLSQDEGHAATCPAPAPSGVRARAGVCTMKLRKEFKRHVAVAGLEPIPGQSGFVNWDARELPDAALRCAASVRGSRGSTSLY